MGKKKNEIKKYAYCDKCEKEVLFPKRKSLEGMQINIWILATLASLGFAIIPFLIYRYKILKKDRCPKCESQLDFYSSRDEIPEPKAQITRILKSIEEEKKVLDEIPEYCPYCKQEIMKNVERCPNCGANLKE